MPFRGTPERLSARVAWPYAAVLSVMNYIWAQSPSGIHPRKHLLYAHTTNLRDRNIVLSYTGS